MDASNTYDAVVLGGGPAGISCALELHELRVNYLLIDGNSRLGGQLPEIKNTIRNFAAKFWQDGSALARDLEELCLRIGLHTRLSITIDAVDLQRKTLSAAQSRYQAGAIFLATGTRMRRLPIDGADYVKENIINCVEDHEERLSGRAVVVVGGGDNALMDSLWLARRCASVLLVHRSHRFRARPDVIKDVLKEPRITVLNDMEVNALTQSRGNLHEVVVRNRLTGDERHYPADYLVIKVGNAPNSELFAGQLEMSESGLVIIDQSCKTSADGVFAGGDLVYPEFPGIGRSVGQGMVAARSILQYLTAN